jgi:propionyl-CoA synthetase
MMYPEAHFFSYGMGWFLSDFKGRKLVEHGGAIDGMRAEVALIPEEKLGVVILTNMNGSLISNPLVYRIIDAYLGNPAKDYGGDLYKAYKPLLDQAVAMASHRPRRCLILQRPMETASMVPGRDVDWREAEAAGVAVECVPVAATDPLYIHYTSGTTGIPKGVVRDHGGHAVALAWSMGHVFSTGPGEVFWAASDIGWTVGHGYIVYGPLLHGATTILYEGKPVGTPDAGAFWRVVEQHGVNVLFTAPTAFRAIKREDPQGLFMRKHDLSRFRLLFLAGERCDPDTLLWAQERLGVPVIDHWWQTELGWPAIANCAGLGIKPIKPGSPTLPVPGYDIRVINDEGEEVAADEIGKLVIKLPLPPGALPFRR